MKKTVGILIMAVIIFCIGSVTAYYNTASVGYDNANLISFQSDGIQVLDFKIYYRDIERTVEKMKDLVPDNFITI